MKRTLLLTLLAAAPAFGQWHHFGEARATGFFGVGATAPVNPTARITDTGWNFAGGVGVTKNYLGLMLDFSFNDLGLDRSTLRQLGATHGSEKFWALTVDPVFHVNQRGPVDFYVTGGGGLYSRISTLRGPGFGGGPFGGSDELVSSYTTYGAGVDGGAGFAFNVGYTNRVKLFLEARYHRMFRPGRDENYVPVTLGVRF
jgi:hypothetical protein